MEGLAPSLCISTRLIQVWRCLLCEKAPAHEAYPEGNAVAEKGLGQ